MVEAQRAHKDVLLVRKGQLTQLLCITSISDEVDDRGQPIAASPCLVSSNDRRSGVLAIGLVLVR